MTVKPIRWCRVAPNLPGLFSPTARQAKAVGAGIPRWCMRVSACFVIFTLILPPFGPPTCRNLFPQTYHSRRTGRHFSGGKRIKKDMNERKKEGQGPKPPLPSVSCRPRSAGNGGKRIDHHPSQAPVIRHHVRRPYELAMTSPGPRELSTNSGRLIFFLPTIS